jgi:hypothetical protein
MLLCRIKLISPESDMHNRPVRGIIGLTAIGAATAVGLTTHDAGFTALTFVGALIVPRLLGISGHRGGCHGEHGQHGAGGRREHMREHLEGRLEAWHRDAHAAPGAETTAAGGAAPA